MEKATSAPRSDILRLDYASTTLAARALAWKIFVDWRRWSRFTDYYAELRWTHGAPWDVGSRLRMDVVRPDRFVMNRLITMCRPEESIAWIDHSRGTTIEQWLTLEVEPDGLTCIRVVSQAIGSKPMVAGQPFGDFLRDSIKRWVDGFCRECDRAKARARG